jgi:uncharacterized protein
LVYNFSESEEDQTRAISQGVQILKGKGVDKEWSVKRLNMLAQSEICSDFLIWFVENWPESFTIMKTDPAFQKRFE